MKYSASYETERILLKENEEGAFEDCRSQLALYLFHFSSMTTIGTRFSQIRALHGTKLQVFEQLRIPAHGLPWLSLEKKSLHIAPGSRTSPIAWRSTQDLNRHKYRCIRPVPLQRRHGHLARRCESQSTLPRFRYSLQPQLRQASYRARPQRQRLVVFL
jgi:hypothetical protein